ncbi:MAG: InlB B-repeat-containing protein [Methanomassiliicoccaceae archaeon]|nr:InlB B-repeat-containing protein [Methanomassiliicoccaceae archaeon]
MATATLTVFVSDESVGDPELEWDTSLQAGDLAALKAAVSAAADGDPVSIELTADIAFAAAADMITVPANKIIRFTSADVPGAPFTIDATGLNRAISVAAGGTLYLSDITITGGNVTGTNQGGGVYNEGTLILNSGATVSGNKAAQYGGGIYNSNILTVDTGAVIFGNTANYGGGVANRTAAAVFTMNGGEIYRNTASYGGGVYNYGGTFTMKSGDIFGHTTAIYGGGVYNTGTFNMSQGDVPSTIYGNMASEGGGVHNCEASAEFNLSGGAILGNAASYTGGGVNNEDRAKINMSGGTISGNTAILGGTSSGFGGGICNWRGAVAMSGGEISWNEARFGGGVFNYLTNVFDMSGNALISNNKGLLYQYSSGGGVYNYGLFTMYDNAAIIDNSATWGGGVFNEYNTFTMESGKIAGNSGVSGNGGGIYVNNSVDPYSNVRINGGTISGNTTSANGGGIWISHADLNKVSVAPGVIFSDNSAATAYSRSPADDGLYSFQIGTDGEGVTWTDPFTQGYNNFDIGYIGVNRLVIVTFMQNHSDTDDTVFKKATVGINTAIGAQMPNDPVMAGYEFTEWNALRDGSGIIYTDLNPVITADTVVFAQWAQLPPPPTPPTPPTTVRYTVTYDGNGNTSGTAPVDNNTYSSAEFVAVLGQGDLVKADHAFLGWAANKNSAVATHSPGSSFRIYYNITLYTVWERDDMHTVTFIDWDDTVLKAEKVPHGGSATAPGEPSREGYIFAGWDKPFDHITSDLVVKALYEGHIGSPQEQGKGEWALLNLILALIGIFVAVVAAVYKIKRKGERKGIHNEAALFTERSFAWIFVAVIAAIAGIVFFFVTEDMRLPMTFVDKWTVISILIFIAVITAAAAALWSGGHRVFRQNSSIEGKGRAKSGSPYSFTVKGGYAGAVSYRIGEEGQWKLAFPDGNGTYTLPGEEVSDAVYLENHP